MIEKKTLKTLENMQMLQQFEIRATPMQRAMAAAAHKKLVQERQAQKRG